MMNPRNIAYALGVSLFSRHSSYPLPDAERNLSGRTHYVDAATLKFFNARILSSRVFANGLIFGLCESTRFDNEPREYAFVLFDVTGTVLFKEKSKNHAAARAAMESHVESLDVQAYYAEVMRAEIDRAEKKAKNLRAVLAEGDV